MGVFPELRQGFHRIGNHYGRFFDRDRFLGRDLWDDNWIQPDTHPYANLKQQDKIYILEVVVSGFKKEELNVSVHNHVLTVRGQKEKGDDNKSVYVKREYDTDSFTRVFELTADIDMEKVSAKLENGLLSIELMRSDEQGENETTRRIKVL